MSTAERSGGSELGLVFGWRVVIHTYSRRRVSINSDREKTTTKKTLNSVKINIRQDQ